VRARKFARRHSNPGVINFASNDEEDDYVKDNKKSKTSSEPKLQICVLANSTDTMILYKFWAETLLNKWKL